jgi:hypothetical protein
MHPIGGPGIHRKIVTDLTVLTTFFVGAILLVGIFEVVLRSA